QEQLNKYREEYDLLPEEDEAADGQEDTETDEAAKKEKEEQDEKENKKQEEKEKKEKWIGLERKRKMTEKILMVRYRDHLHKCHLPGDEKKEITVGNAWTDTVTFLTLEQKLPIVWDSKACIIEESMLQVNEQKT